MKILVLSLLGLFLVFCGLVQAIDESLVLYFSLMKGKETMPKTGFWPKTMANMLGNQNG